MAGLFPKLFSQTVPKTFKGQSSPTFGKLADKVQGQNIFVQLFFLLFFKETISNLYFASYKSFKFCSGMQFLSFEDLIQFVRLIFLVWFLFGSWRLLEIKIECEITVTAPSNTCLDLKLCCRESTGYEDVRWC